MRRLAAGVQKCAQRRFYVVEIGFDIKSGTCVVRRVCNKFPSSDIWFCVSTLQPPVCPQHILETLLVLESTVGP